MVNVGMGWAAVAVVFAIGCGGGGGGGGSALGTEFVRDAAAGAPETNPAGDASAAADATDTGDGAAPAAETWTAIYGDLLANPAYPSGCTGAQCHAPGHQKGIDFSTKERGFASIQSRVVPGSPQSSSLMTTLSSGAMPQTRPRMPAADLDRIRAWITSGAADN